MRPSISVLLALALLASPAIARADETTRPSPRRLAVAVGFSHWFGATFGSPDGYSTPTFSVGVRPGLRFLELRFRTTFSVRAFDFGTGRSGPASFTSLGVLLEHEIRLGRQSFGAFVGPEAIAVRADGTSFGFGLALGVELLVRTGLPDHHAVGFFLAAREVFFELASDQDSLRAGSRRDGQIDLGVITTFF